MTKEEIDTMWQQAMQESIKNNEMYTRYHFAKLVAEKEREAFKQIIRETPFSNWFQADLIEAIDKRRQA
jgi:succinate dehydrogenase flavin-adding protein (antitoxin of CptAB toxin-antitoxin module)